MRRPFTIFFIVGLCVTPRVSVAQERARIALRLEYEAPSECPPVDAFLEQVRERAPDVRIAMVTEPAKIVRVVLTSTRGEGVEPFAGALTLLDLEGHEAKRTIAGESCGDVAGALALVVALDAVQSAQRSSSTQIESLDKPSIPSAERSSPPLPTPPRWESSVLANFGGRIGVSNRAAPSVGAAFSLSRENAPSPWSPAFRIGVDYAVAHDRSGPSAVANGSVIPDDWLFRLFTTKLDACTLRIEAARFLAMPCVRVEVGLHYGEVATGASKSTPWFGTGVLGRGRLRLVSLLFAELELGIMVPFVRNRFFSDAVSRNYVVVVPALAPFVTLAAGLTFP